MPMIPWHITIIAFIVGIAGVMAVGAAMALLAQDIMRRTDSRPLRQPTASARLLIFACLLTGIAIESWLMHRAWTSLAEFWLFGGGALETTVALAAGPAAVILLVVITYLATAPEAFCRTACRKVIPSGKLQFRENIIPVPLALATGCVPVEELENGSVILLARDCPDRAVQKMLERKLGAKARYVRARSREETEFLKDFFRKHGDDYRPVTFEKENFLNRPDAVEQISRGRKPDAAAVARVPEDSVLLVETAVFFRSHRVFSIDPRPLFAADWGISYWPYMNASLAEDGKLILTRHYKKHVRPEVPEQLIFENRIIDGDVHGHGIRLVDPSDWVAMRPPSDYRVAGLDDKSNLVIEIAGNAHAVSRESCPTDFFDEKYFLLESGRIFERRLRLSVRNFRVIPRDRIEIAEPAAETPPPLDETADFPPPAEAAGIQR